MTSDERFGRELSAWLDEDARGRVPGHLGEVLVQTVATRQRPWWASAERWLPMTSIALGGRAAARTPILLVIAIALLLAATVGFVLVAGRPAPTFPAGAASNGRIVAMDGFSLVTYASDGSDRRVLLSLDSASILTLGVSPDGTRVAYRNGANAVQIARLADGVATNLRIDGAADIDEDSIDWSPDGRELTFGALTSRGQDIAIAAADGSSVRFLGDSIGTATSTVFRPTYSPDGEWIAFGGDHGGVARLFIVHPDGTGLRELETDTTPELGDGGGVIWSPDRTVHRLAYETLAGDTLSLHVLDVDTGTDHSVGDGFWPSWSPDGSHLAACCAVIWRTDDVLAGTPFPVRVFQASDGSCGDNHQLSGSAICTPVTWSPDGQWVIGGDIAAKDLLLARVDGTGRPTRLTATTGVIAAGFRVPLGWQPVWP